MSNIGSGVRSVPAVRGGSRVLSRGVVPVLLAGLVAACLVALSRMSVDFSGMDLGGTGDETWM